MALTGTRTYVGFGFGAIQSGLFLYEAFQSGAFGRLVVAEVLPDVVAALRRAEGYFTVNIARADGIEQARVGPVQIEDPAEAADRQRVIEAIAAADELATAIPSVTNYTTQKPGSLHRILAAGLRQKVAQGGPRAVVYAAENHNRAAEILEAKVRSEIPPGELKTVGAKVRFLNTVIGKMSGIITDPGELDTLRLTPVTPGARRAFLVEAFNRILISRIRFDEWPDELPFRRGIAVFQEKPDLLPFEEAKLYGHNATHALAAYLARMRAIPLIADLTHQPGMMRVLRAAFIEESGESLIRKHAGLDPLFSASGYAAYADDLLARMTNPYLHDTVDRVGRDPARKLGWDDRLIGTLRLALRQNVAPRRYAFGTAAALAALDRAVLESRSAAEKALGTAWQSAAPDPGEREAVLTLVEAGRQQLRRWLEAGFPDLEDFILRDDF